MTDTGETEERQDRPDPTPTDTGVRSGADEGSPVEPLPEEDPATVASTTGEVAGGLLRLYRSEEERILGGVAGGLADYFDADPVIVRLLWVVTVLLGGTGVLAYLVLWIVLPPYSRIYGEHDPADGPVGHPVRQAGTQRMPVRTDLIFGGILVVLGGLMLIGNMNFGPGWNIFGRLWPLLLIAPAAAMVAPRGGRWGSTGVLLVGGVVLVVGMISLIGSLNVWLGYGAWGRLWPLVLVAIGTAFVLPRMDRND